MFRRAFTTAAKMSTYTTDKASPFTRAVISSMRKLYVFCLRANARLTIYLLLDILNHWPTRALITLAVGMPLNVTAIISR